MRVKKQQLEPYMEKVTGQKLRKEYNKAVYCHPAYLTCVQRTSGENQKFVLCFLDNVNHCYFNIHIC